MGRGELRGGRAAAALDLLQGRGLRGLLPEQRDQRDHVEAPLLRLLRAAPQPLPALHDGGAHQAPDQPRAVVLRGGVADRRAEPDAARVAQVREGPRRHPHVRARRRALHGQDAEDVLEGLLADVPRGRAGHAGGQVVPGDRRERARQEQRGEDPGLRARPRGAAGRRERGQALLRQRRRGGHLLLPGVRRLPLRAVLRGAPPHRQPEEPRAKPLHRLRDLQGQPGQAAVHLHPRQVLRGVLHEEARKDPAEVPGPQAPEDRLPEVGEGAPEAGRGGAGPQALVHLGGRAEGDLLAARAPRDDPGREVARVLRPPRGQVLLQLRDPGVHAPASG
mmetsp:Transcript_72756/g.190753  ORF Transcript_72756/g.190753 Transcript_72756/m.190753 type:complete len:334 (+) Transcript_72756:756-1757(+)